MSKVVRVVLLGLAVVSMVSWTTVQAGSSDDLNAIKAKNRELEARLSKIETISAATALSDGQREETRTLVTEMLQDASVQSGMPKWAQGLTFSADFRLRYEYRNRKRYAASNPNQWNPWAAPGVNAGGGALPSDHRMRYRLRFGFVKKWDEYEVGFRLVSAAAGQNRSGNTDLGNNFAFGYDPISIDLAYAKWTPNFLKGFSLTGGKMKNPFYSTDIIFDDEITPEGLWAQYEYKDLMNGDLMPFIGMGLFQVQDFGGRTPSPWSSNLAPGTNNCDAVLFAYDIGVIYKMTEDVKATFAFTYYDWTHYEEAVPGFAAGGTASNPWIASSAMGLGGNVGPNLHFGVIDFMHKVDWNLPFAFGGYEKLPLSVWFEMARNVKDGYAGAFDSANTTLGLADPWIIGNVGDPNSTYKNHWFNERNAYTFGMKIGQNKKKGDWSIAYKYAWIEANSTPALVTDVDFGGTNRKGHVLRLKYNVEDYFTLGANIFMTSPIHSPRQFLGPQAGSMWSTEGDKNDTTVQLDAEWRF